jgi:hypothetical protein
MLPFLFLLILSGCDPEGRKDCVWTLETEAKPQLVSHNAIPSCVRNRETMKQDCKLQVSMEVARTVSGKFRYDDIKWDRSTSPKTFLEVSLCQE